MAAGFIPIELDRTLFTKGTGTSPRQISACCSASHASGGQQPPRHGRPHPPDALHQVLPHHVTEASVSHEAGGDMSKESSLRSQQSNTDLQDNTRAPPTDG